MINKMNRGLVYVSVASNVMLAWLLIVKLHVAPSDVMNEVKLHAGEIQRRHEITSARIDELQEVVDGRTTIIKAFNGQCAAMAKEMLEKEQFAEWCQKAKELNPQLEIPEVAIAGER